MSKTKSKPPTVTITIEYPPATNNLYPTVMRGKTPIRVLSSRGKKYKRHVADVADGANIPKHEGPVTVVFRVWRRMWHGQFVGDLDGTFKIVLDALTGIAYNDDEQVDIILARRYDDEPDNPRIELTIAASGSGLAGLHL